jgi:hypothetical protein
MSQRRSSAEPFVPFELPHDSPGAVPAPGPAANPPALRVSPRSDTTPPFTPLEARPAVAAHAHSPGNRAPGKPVITLQREGDHVTGIHIECACGQIIELACNYATNPVAP